MSRLIAVIINNPSSSRPVPFSYGPASGDLDVAYAGVHLHKSSRARPDSIGFLLQGYQAANKEFGRELIKSSLSRVE